MSDFTRGGGSRPSQTCLAFGQIFFSRRPLIHSDVAFDPDNKSPRWDASKPLIHITEKSVTPLLEMAEQTIYIDKIDIFYCRQHWPISLVICSRQLKIRQNFENTYFNMWCDTLCCRSRHWNILDRSSLDKTQNPII